MPELVGVKRALISVSDKTGLEPFAKVLHVEFGVELLSTGGTAQFLRSLGLPVTDVAEVTGFPEMMSGRVKTLHPKIHGAILGLRDDPDHQTAMAAHGITPIDLVCVNLYPFEQTVAKPGVTLEEAIENIDIGGPSMIRSAAKNHRWVLVVTSPKHYDPALENLRAHQGSSSGDYRLRQAQRAFEQTAQYDAAIAGYLLTPAMGDVPWQSAAEIRLKLLKKQDLRYGENPHQKAALYVEERPPREASVAFAKQLHGKELSYINLLDADGALAAVRELATPAACIVKHATPCGFATATDLATAFRNAYAGDPLAAFGGIVAFNQDVDLACAQAIVSIDKLLEVIVAPSFTPDALALLKTRWKNVRLLEVGALGPCDPQAMHMHKIVGGYLIQERDLAGADAKQWKVVSKRPPTEQETQDLMIAYLACKHVKSNAIVLARQQMVVGVGGGQVDRVGAAQQAIAKAGARAAGTVAASDAFFPFADGPQALLQAGVTAIVQPGGSLRDADSIAAVDAAGAAMVFSGQRHFRH
jgi:phosphoribosylaminoimidazolecarboxamide formyltransferase/IMP cyclohydrolase